MKKHLLLFLISALLIIPAIYLRRFNFSLSLSFSFVSYFLILVLFSKNSRKTTLMKDVLFLSFPPVLVYGFIHFGNFKETLISLPTSLAPFFGMLTAAIFLNLKGIITKFFLALGSLSLLLVIYFYGYNYWSHKIVNYVFYDNLTGTVEIPVPPDILFLDNDFGKVVFDSILANSSQPIVLDFWNIYCGPCFAQFPSFEKKSQNGNYKFFSVNVPIRDEPLQKRRKAVEQFNFPKLYTLDRTLTSKFGIKVFPTILVIDEGKVIYRGNLYGYDFRKNK